MPRLALEPIRPPLQCVQGVNWQMCEAGHSPPSSAEVKNGGAIPPFPHLPSWLTYVIKYWDNFTFLLYTVNVPVCISCMIF
jgi:hypothetical protein